MPATAPPFPTAGSPHLDIELRDLYSRVNIAERALGIGEGTPSTPPVTDVFIQLIEATPVKLLQGFVRFDEGWSTPGWPQMRRDSILLGDPVPPFVVLDVVANLDVPFNYDLPFAPLGFGVSTDVDTGVDEKRYYAGTGGQDVSRLDWQGQELNLSRPNAGDAYANVGVVQTARRPIVAGFFWVGPRPFTDWPADMEGQLQVLVLYADSDIGGESVPLSQLADRTLLHPTGL